MGDDIINEGHQEAMRPVLHWIQVANALVRARNSTVVWNTSRNPAIPFPPVAEHLQHRLGLLHKDLPSLAPAPPALPAGSVVQALNSLTTEQRQTRQEAADQARARNTAESHCGPAVDILLRLCKVHDHTLLPPIHETVANATKKNERATIQEAINEASRTLALSECAPLITHELAKPITTAEFCHVDIDDLAGGLQPFLTCHRSVENRAQLNGAATACDTIQGGAGTQLANIHKLDEANIHKLDEANKIDLPGTLLQTLSTLCGFQIPLHVVLGPGHRVHHACEESVRLFCDRLMALESCLKATDCPSVIRWHQICISHWFNCQMDTPAEITSPDP